MTVTLNRRLGRGRLTPLAGALALTFMSGVTSLTAYPIHEPGYFQEPRAIAKLGAPPSGEAAGDSSYYTVVFKAPALANYAGGTGNLQAIPRQSESGKLDVNSPAARAYVSYLEHEQDGVLNELAASFGRPLDVQAKMQHALNAVIVALTTEEAAAVAARDDVLVVEREQMLPLMTDAGPSFIGAPALWNGQTPNNVGTRGAGVVVGIIDTGINWQSPAFAAVGPIDGYVHQNPRGAGNYLGLCQEGFADVGRCNDKLIGIYDFTSTSPTRSGTDLNGHGSHTAGTSAGNLWQATYGNGPFTVSGVAPHANIISYRACVANCATTATTQSVNQAVADGVDVINFSIGGGTSPWTDTTSIAFRNAAAAGMFIAASAGNTRAETPDPQGQVNHLEPWVQTVAASTHDRVIAMRVDLTSVSNPPANTQNIPVRPGGSPTASANLIDVPVIKSPTFDDGANDACSPFPANTFARASGEPAIFRSGFEEGETGVGSPALVPGVAVVHLSGGASNCLSGERRTNVLNAGAIGIIFVDTDYLNLGASGTTWSMLRSDWDNLEAAMDPATATITIDVASQAFPGVGDVMADFSFRGPRLIGGQVLVKPDITAPGVAILAAGAAGVVGPEGAYLSNGTSMSSPHMAGAGALLRALHPSWSPAQMKSALNLTANNFGVVNHDDAPIRPWDYGSGRVNLQAAARVGLVMDENEANYVAANPAAGGDVSTLNLPSIASANALGTVQFTRTFRRVRSGSETYVLSHSGLPDDAVTVTPSQFTLSGGGSRTITVSIDSTLLPEAAWAFGSVTLTPVGVDEPVLNLPVAVRPAGPQIAVDPSSLSATSDDPITLDLQISNPANPTLNWQIQTSGMQTITPFNASFAGSGWQGGRYLGFSPTPRGYYWAQNFDVTSAMRVTTLRANGFTLGGGLTADNTPNVTFSIYADDAGNPAGAPEGFGAAPVWTFTGAISAANGITVTGGNLQLDLGAVNVASTPLNLTPGRYWLSVWPSINGVGSQNADNPLWAWRISSDPQIGSVPKLFAPWTDAGSVFQTGNGLTMLSGFVEGVVDCNLPSWVELTTTSGALGAGASQSIPVTFNPAARPAGTYTGFLCISSNATNQSLLPVPLSFTIPTGTPSPTVTKAFAPTSVPADTPSTLTLTLGNPHTSAATLTANLVDTLPTGLVVAPTPNASTTCAGGSVTANAGGGSVTLAPGAEIPAGGSCTVSVDTVASTPTSYVNTIAAGALQTDTGTSQVAANATLTVTALIGAPTVAASFSPSSVTAGTPSTVTLTLSNGNAAPATLTASLENALPPGLLVAPTPAAATTCPSGSVTAVAGATSAQLASGAQIPQEGSCTVTFNARAVTPGTYTNTVAPGALQTDAGNAAGASAMLTVTAGTFPAPYCARTFTFREPITLVRFESIDNASSAATGGASLENFLEHNATVRPGSTYAITVKGNSDGNFTNVYRVYFDWNQDGVFSEDASERYEIGSITNSTGLDAAQASTTITVPMSATVGTTRMRVVKNYNAGGPACGSPTNTFGQAEDYSVTIDPSAPVPPPVPHATASFSPALGDIADGSTLTLTFSQFNSAGVASLTSPMTAALPAGMTVAATPSASTTCNGGGVTATGGASSFSVDVGTEIPASGSCTVQLDVVASAAGMYNFSIPAGALQTDAGNSAAVVAATYRGLDSGQPQVSFDFEAPAYTVGDIGGQQGWTRANTTPPSSVSNAMPFAGSQHLRVTALASGSTAPSAISPTQIVGTSAYSQLRARVRLSRTTDGATFELNPQDPVAGVVSTLLRFDRGASRSIMIVNWGAGVYQPTGATWPVDQYFDLLLQFDRAANSLEVCVDGTSIYSGASAVNSVYIGNAVARQVLQTGSTAGNTMDVDDLVIANTDTAIACTPPDQSLDFVPVTDGEKVSRSDLRH